MRASTNENLLRALPLTLFTQLLIDMNVRNTFSEKMFSWKLIIQHQRNRVLLLEMENGIEWCFLCDSNLCALCVHMSMKCMFYIFIHVTRGAEKQTLRERKI